MSLLAEHLRRVELENESEHFADLSPGGLARLYSGENLAKPLNVQGWARLWTVERYGRVVAHASVYDLAEHEIVFGHISIEREHRGSGLARVLQRMRFRFLDEHGLTLCGGIARGNEVSLRGCLANGFEVLRVDHAGTTWVYRDPVSRSCAVDRMDADGRA